MSDLNNQVFIRFSYLCMFFMFSFFQGCSESEDIVAPVDPCSLSIVAAEELDISPTIVRNVAPIYPHQAIQEGWEGSAKALAVINADSSICSVRIIESSGRDDVDNSVLTAFNRSVFASGVLNSEPVRAEMETTFWFGIAMGENGLLCHLKKGNGTK